MTGTPPDEVAHRRRPGTGGSAGSFEHVNLVQSCTWSRSGSQRRRRSAETVAAADLLGVLDHRGVIGERRVGRTRLRAVII
jgi:hypothetical protein